VIVVAERVDGVRFIEKVLVRKSGAGFHLDIHVQVDPDLSIRAAHSLGGKVKSTLRKELPGLVTALIHVEPFEQTKSEDHSPRVADVASRNPGAE
jgi:divalent metal cation (Fe/Co/Zn/Cd) transporter